MKLSAQLDSVQPIEKNGPCGRRWKLSTPERGIHIEATATRTSPNRLLVKLHTKATGIGGEWFDCGFILQAEEGDEKFHIYSLDGEEMRVSLMAPDGGIPGNILSPKGGKKK